MSNDIGGREGNVPVSHGEIVVNVSQSILDDRILSGNVSERSRYTRVVEPVLFHIST